MLRGRIPFNLWPENGEGEEDFMAELVIIFGLKSSVG